VAVKDALLTRRFLIGSRRAADDLSQNESEIPISAVFVAKNASRSGITQNHHH
jgi:hypothetical protein